MWIFAFCRLAITPDRQGVRVHIDAVSEAKLHTKKKIIPHVRDDSKSLRYSTNCEVGLHSDFDFNTKSPRFVEEASCASFDV
ncbi:MAG: hypothetical protein FD163_2369 [Hyphomonadaceae bacterium]|nr:MAG: hypothetical protein FD128_1281 [Hyphomonadaceae bacterium]KAF0183649.1 MAG: hypothetical protein FD163_2369 [Hyphomonadaceae bacterium]